jgi:hypothetical protein
MAFGLSARLVRLSLLDRDQRSFDVRIPVSAATFVNALEIAELILVAHKPPDVTEPAEELAAPFTKASNGYHLVRGHHR